MSPRSATIAEDAVDRRGQFAVTNGGMARSKMTASPGPRLAAHDASVSGHNSRPRRNVATPSPRSTAAAAARRRTGGGDDAAGRRVEADRDRAVSTHTNSQLLPVGQRVARRSPARSAARAAKAEVGTAGIGAQPEAGRARASMLGVAMPVVDTNTSRRWRGRQAAAAMALRAASTNILSVAARRAPCARPSHAARVPVDRRDGRVYRSVHCRTRRQSVRTSVAPTEHCLCRGFGVILANSERRHRGSDRRRRTSDKRNTRTRAPSVVARAACCKRQCSERCCLRPGTGPKAPARRRRSRSAKSRNSRRRGRWPSSPAWRGAHADGAGDRKGGPCGCSTRPAAPPGCVGRARVSVGGQGGLGDVVVHRPSFQPARLSQRRRGRRDGTRARARLGRWSSAAGAPRLEGFRTIWRQSPRSRAMAISATHRFAATACSIVVGVTGEIDPGAGPGGGLGKILRLTAEGAPAAGNRGRAARGRRDLLVDRPSQRAGPGLRPRRARWAARWDPRAGTSST